MNINRHNYEEYFILYIDNELGSEDRRQVEEFIEKHPDLSEELDILLQYKMVPDTSIIFDGKEKLMIHDDQSTVSPVNYEEWLMMYIDNELTAGQKIQLEQFLTSNPRAKKELEILRQTKLQPEEIIFSNKKSLYRKEETARIISISWWRVAAAAILIAAFSLTAIVLLTKKSPSKTEVAKIPDNSQKVKSENAVITNNKEQKKNTQPVVANNQLSIIANQKHKTDDIAAKRINARISKNLPLKELVKVKNEPLMVGHNNNLPQPLNNPYLNDDASNNTLAKVDITKETIISQKSLTNDPVTTNSVQPSNVVYNPSTDGNDLNQSGGKKGKLRGFLRKVTRTFEKNTNINATDDDDRVLIGGLALKLK